MRLSNMVQPWTPAWLNSHDDNHGTNIMFGNAISVEIPYIYMHPLQEKIKDFLVIKHVKKYMYISTCKLSLIYQYKHGDHLYLWYIWLDMVDF